MKVLLVSDTTVASFQRPLGRVLREMGIEPGIESCEYALHELFDPTGAPFAADPDLTLLSVHARELVPELFRARTLMGPKHARIAICERAADTLLDYARRLREGTRGPVLIFDLVIPERSPLGIQDRAVSWGLRVCISRINEALIEGAAELADVHVVARSSVAALMGGGRVDPKLRYLAGQEESAGMLDALAEEVARHVHALTGRTRKVLVLDLDNTLWGGVIGEDGLAGICLDPSGRGRAYRDFQRACMDLRDRGVLLAIASKNNREDALEALEQHPHMLLRPEHFSAMEIHWEDKATSCLRIAEALNVGSDSLVFFDDNPVEREWVASALPEVEVVAVPRDPARYVQALESLRSFETAALSGEDARRSELYAQEASREVAQQSATSMEDYLAGLRTRLTLGPVDRFTLPRVVQLINKSNQMNMTTRRRTSAEVEALASRPDRAVLWARVEDRFGDAGIVGVAVVERGDAVWTLDTLLLSCRVLKRGVEQAFVHAIARAARDAGADALEGLFLATRKNAPNRYLYQGLGFSIVEQSEDRIHYRLELIGAALSGVPFIQLDADLNHAINHTSKVA